MRSLTYRLSFNTPAFLGNAEQNAQWRTPPFKAMLRQWWRVVKAKEFNYNHGEMRRAEMRLFGAASGSGNEGSHRSLVRLRLSSWQEGKLPSVSSGDMVQHVEVPGGKVGANLYLGYGPIGGLARSAISPEESANTLTIHCPDQEADDIRKAMQLAAWFGTLGSRARNGWGSLHIEGEGIKGFAELKIPELTSVIEPRPLTECLDVEWLHALGCDSTGLPLVWRLLKKGDAKRQLVPFNSWEEVMRELARIKIQVRTSDFFKFKGGGPGGHPNPQPRHLLAYPAGSQHNVAGWGNNGRLANQVLFKVHRHKASGHEGFAATIAHFPSRLPRHMAVGRQVPDQVAVWEEVHRLLDAEKANGLGRIKGAQA